VPYAFDTSIYQKTNKKLDFKEDNYKFKFYYIADLNDRKNIESVIRCFHSEFANYEPVALILKVKKYGVNPLDLKKHIIDICNRVKKSMRIYENIEEYHNEIIISEEVDEYFISSLHQSCDCLINTTHGEGWSIPAFDAMCYGKTPICCNEGGPKEFIDSNNKDCGTLVNGTMTICNHSDPAFPNIFTGLEHWFTPSEKEIKKAMRYYYENKDKIDRSAGIKYAEKFSYENVGTIIKDLINV
jgi:glycogen synthase